MSDADELLLIAAGALHQRSRLMLPDGLEVDDLDVIEFAVRFYAMPAGFRLRALVERWSRERIHREMY